MTQQPPKGPTESHVTTPLILVVESSSWMRKMFAAMLAARKRPGEYAIVPSIDAARRILQTKPADLLILSSAPVGGTGIELLREVRANRNTASLPVIMISAKENLEEEIEANRAGVDLYETRSLNWGRLTSQIDRLIGSRRLQWSFLSFPAFQITVSTPAAVGAMAALTIVAAVVLHGIKLS